MYYEQPYEGMSDSDVQVYKASNPGLGVRVYFMIYQMTAEEHKYLASLRKEKDSFERLIRERGVSTQLVVRKDVTKLSQTMLIPIHENQRAGSDVGEAIIKTISSRVAGGRTELSTEASRVRSSC
jgi:DNA excision repair protein ERCC-4